MRRVWILVLVLVSALIGGVALTQLAGERTGLPFPRYGQSRWDVVLNRWLDELDRYGAWLNRQGTWTAPQVHRAPLYVEDAAGQLHAVEPWRTGGTAGAICGDGLINQTSEQCDVRSDGVGQIDPTRTTCQVLDDCRSDCTCPPRTTECGNLLVEPGEVCDPPGQIGAQGCQATQLCNATCTACEAQQQPDVCGDGQVTGSELCDPPGCLSTAQGQQCPAYAPVCNSVFPCNGCTACGNGSIDAGEECDPGSQYCTDPEAQPIAADDAACRTRCTRYCVCPPPVCGNGILERGEQCEPALPETYPGGRCLNCAFVPDSPAPSGNSYLISPTGTDSSAQSSGWIASLCTGAGVPHPCCSGPGVGTCSGPWKTFAHALPRLQPGDTLLLEDGEYGVAQGTGTLAISCGPASQYFSSTTYTGTPEDGFINSLYPCSNTPHKCGIPGVCAGGSRAGKDCVFDSQCPNSSCTMTNAKLITVKARRPRKAIVRSRGCENAVSVQSCKGWRLQDLVATIRDNKACYSAPWNGGTCSSTTPCADTRATCVSGQCRLIAPTIRANDDNQIGQAAIDGTTIVASGMAYEPLRVDNGQYILLAGLLANGNNRYMNANGVAILRSADVVVERLETYRSSRNPCYTHGSYRTVFSGVFCSKTGREPLWNEPYIPGGPPAQAPLSYPGAYTITESSIGTDAHGIGDQNGRYVKHLGSVSFRNQYFVSKARRSATLYPYTSGTAMPNALYENMVMVDVSDGQPVVYLRGHQGGVVRNVTSVDDATSGDGIVHDIETAEVPNSTAFSIDIRNSLAMNTTTTAGTGILVAAPPSGMTLSCTARYNAVWRKSPAFSVGPCTASNNITLASAPPIGLTGTQCVAYIPASATDLIGAGEAATAVRVCVGGSNAHGTCTADADCPGGACRANIGANTACRYYAGVRRGGEEWRMWVSGTATPANCVPGTHVTTVDGVAYPACHGRFFGCGPIVAGINDMDGFACADIHERLNLRSDGSGCPIPGCGSSVTVTTTTTTTTTIATTTTTTTSTTTTTLSSTQAAADWTEYMAFNYRFDEATGTRHSADGTTCVAQDPTKIHLTQNVSNVSQDTVNVREGVASVLFPAPIVLSPATPYPMSCLRSTASLSIGGWVRPSVLNAEQLVVTYDNNSAPGAGVRISLNAANQIVMGLGISGLSSFRYCVRSSGASIATVDTWAHIAGTFFEGSDYARTYINGVQETPSSTCNGLTGLINWSGVYSFRIGHTSPGIRGRVDDLYATVRPLTAADHARVASCGVNGAMCRCSSSTPSQYASCNSDADCGAAGAICTDNQCRGRLPASVTLSACNATPPAP